MSHVHLASYEKQIRGIQSWIIFVMNMDVVG
jgi:hypothetical protein